MAKIYFAGSIRGGTQKQKHYREMIDYLKQFGHTVLSEHIFNGVQDTLDDVEIYKRDIRWIEESDCVVADVTLPSLGVGYEIAYVLHDRSIPVLCIAEEGVRVSAMLTGNPLCEVIYYTFTDTVVTMIHKWIGEKIHGR